MLKVMRKLGTAASVTEIHDRVVASEGLQKFVSQIHAPDKSRQTEIQYRLTWARTFLRKYGLVRNEGRGVWSLTPKGRTSGNIDSLAVVRSVQGMDRKARSEVGTGSAIQGSTSS